MARIQSIYRYPIKGLSPEPLPQATLSPGETVPGDRLYAIENGPSPFDPVLRPYLPKTHFLMLMRNERLAALRTSFDHATHTLTVVNPFKGNAGARHAISSTSPCRGEDGAPTGPARSGRPDDKLRAPGGGPSPNGRTNDRVDRPGAGPSDGQEDGETVSADLRTAAGRATIEAFFARYCADELRGPPRILHAPGHSFSDVARKVVSFINLASVTALAEMIGPQLHGAKLNPLRFRGNVYVEGWPAWSELDLVDKELLIFPPPEGGRTAHEVRQEGDLSFPPPRAGEGATGGLRSPHFEERRREASAMAKHGGGGPSLIAPSPAPTRLKIIKRIVRCAATNVDPATGARDLNIPHTLMHHLGHADCGIYAEVIEGGEIAAGNVIEIF